VGARNGSSEQKTGIEEGGGRSLDAGDRKF
jgi:hypothetical protein